jgi:hypothetical protein
MTKAVCTALSRTGAETETCPVFYALLLTEINDTVYHTIQALEKISQQRQAL